MRGEKAPGDFFNEPLSWEKKNMKFAMKGLCAALLCGAVAGAPALAQPPHGMGGGGHSAHMMSGDHGMGMGHGAERADHGSSWRASLTTEQKSEIALSHLRLRQKQAVVGARIALQEVEIATVVASDENDDARLQAAVDELVGLQKERALNRYRHLMEVRQLLTPQQRVSFDLWVLSDKDGDHHR